MKRIWESDHLTYECETAISLIGIEENKSLLCLIFSEATMVWSICFLFLLMCDGHLSANSAYVPGEKGAPWTEEEVGSTITTTTIITIINAIIIITIIKIIIVRTACLMIIWGKFSNKNTGFHGKHSRREGGGLFIMIMIVMILIVIIPTTSPKMLAVRAKLWRLFSGGKPEQALFLIFFFKLERAEEILILYSHCLPFLIKS